MSCPHRMDVQGKGAETEVCYVAHESRPGLECVLGAPMIASVWVCDLGSRSEWSLRGHMANRTVWEQKRGRSLGHMEWRSSEREAKQN